MTLWSMPLAQPVAASLDQEAFHILAGLSPLPWTQPRSPSWGISLLQQQEGISVPSISVKVHVFHYLSPNLRALCPAPYHFTGKGTRLLLKFWDDQSSVQSLTGNTLAETFTGEYASGTTDTHVLAHGTSSSLRMKNQHWQHPKSTTNLTTHFSFKRFWGHWKRSVFTFHDYMIFFPLLYNLGIKHILITSV